MNLCTEDLMSCALKVGLGMVIGFVVMALVNLPEICRAIRRRKDVE